MTESIFQTAISDFNASSEITKALTHNKNIFSVQDAEGVEAFLIYNKDTDPAILSNVMMGLKNTMTIHENCKDNDILPILQKQLIVAKFKYQENKNILEITF